MPLECAILPKALQEPLSEPRQAEEPVRVKLEAGIPASPPPPSVVVSPQEEQRQRHLSLYHTCSVEVRDLPPASTTGGILLRRHRQQQQQSLNQLRNQPIRKDEDIQTPDPHPEQLLLVQLPLMLPIRPSCENLGLFNAFRFNFIVNEVLLLHQVLLPTHMNMILSLVRPKVLCFRLQLRIQYKI